MARIARVELTVLDLASVCSAPSFCCEVAQILRPATIKLFEAVRVQAWIKVADRRPRPREIGCGQGFKHPGLSLADMRFSVYDGTGDVALGCHGFGWLEFSLEAYSRV